MVDRFFGTTIIRTTYGFDDIGKNASLIRNAKTLIREFAIARSPGKYLVNTFPILRHVPEWLPGAGWKRHMKKLAGLSGQVLGSGFEDAKVHLVSLCILDTRIVEGKGKLIVNGLSGQGRTRSISKRSSGAHREPS